MTTLSHRNAARTFLKSALAASLLVGVFGAVSLHADNDKKNPPKQEAKPKPAPRSNNAAPVTRPTPPANRPAFTPQANHPAFTPQANHPTINQPTAHPTQNPGFNRPGENPATNRGPMGNPGAVSHGSFPGSAGRRPEPAGSQTRFTTGGSAIRTRQGGGVSDVHNARLGMDVHNNLGGGRRVIVERPDHSMIVAERGRPGFVQRPYDFHGQNYAVRTYVYRGRTYNRFYRGYAYRGLSLNVYAPGYYYHPAFYGWVYNPWAAPITFSWGWRARPWYAHFGYYFQPYRSYPSAAYWLTDYIIAQDLQASYAANQQAGEADGAPPPGDESAQPALSPEVKQDIADEVKNQLALENNEAQQNTAGQTADPGSSGIARLLSDGRPHTFVAGGNLDVTDDSGKECVVSDGDALQLRQPPAEDATTASLVVLSSKGRPECQISLTVQVTLADLQEMQNQMRESIDKGLQDLQSKQGTGGIPAAPAAAQGTPDAAAYASIAPPPDPNAAAEIQQQNAQAGQAVQDVNNESTQPAAAGDGTAPPPGA